MNDDIIKRWPRHG